MGKAGWSEDSLLINNCGNLHFVIYQINLKDKLAPQKKKKKEVWVNKMQHMCGTLYWAINSFSHHLNREVSFSLLGFSQGDHCSVIVSSDATAGKTLTDGVHGMKKKLRKVSISSR